MPGMTETLTATLRTNHGEIVVRLLPEHAPETVRNFTELAEGQREWTDPRTRRKTAARLYDGTIFHRVIPDSMIQGGDPLGTGTGGPGYRFGDEIHPGLVFGRPRSEEHTSELQSRPHLVCRLLLEKKKNKYHH